MAVSSTSLPSRASQAEASGGICPMVRCRRATSLPLPFADWGESCAHTAEAPTFTGVKELTLR